ncbi:MAG: hypothetical protein ACLTSX_12810 [Collinsella sp.]
MRAIGGIAIAWTCPFMALQLFIAIWSGIGLVEQDVRAPSPSTRRRSRHASSPCVETRCAPVSKPGSPRPSVAPRASRSAPTAPRATGGALRAPSRCEQARGRRAPRRSQYGTALKAARGRAHARHHARGRLRHPALEIPSNHNLGWMYPLCLPARMVLVSALLGGLFFPFQRRGCRAAVLSFTLFGIGIAG